MLGASKAAPAEFCIENQTTEWMYFSGLVFSHCWSRGLYVLKLLTIATGPSALFWFNREGSASFYWKSYWSESFSVLWLKWLFESKTSCLSALVAQKELENSQNQFSFDLKAAPEYFLFFLFSPSLTPSFRVFEDFLFVWVCFCFVFERAVKPGLW